jgi:NADH-quinone oxidoreductase subunit F
MLERVVRGEATPMDLDIISSVQNNIIGHCLCVLGDSMAMPVSAMVNKFRDEFEQVIADAAMAGLPTTEGRESQEAGVEPGPGSVGIEVLRRERLQGRPVPGDAQKAAEELPSA